MNNRIRSHTISSSILLIISIVFFFSCVQEDDTIEKKADSEAGKMNALITRQDNNILNRDIENIINSTADQIIFWATNGEGDYFGTFYVNSADDISATYDSSAAKIDNIEVKFGHNIIFIEYSFQFIGNEVATEEGPVRFFEFKVEKTALIDALTAQKDLIVVDVLVEEIDRN